MPLGQYKVYTCDINCLEQQKLLGPFLWSTPALCILKPGGGMGRRQGEGSGKRTEVWVLLQNLKSD